jgi:hypothetical protein
VIHGGDTYSDLGATITGPAADTNLGIQASVDGGATTTLDHIALDTSTSSSHTILYFATNQNGLIRYSSRTVIVEAATSTLRQSPGGNHHPAHRGLAGCRLKTAWFLGHRIRQSQEGNARPVRRADGWR